MSVTPLSSQSAQPILVPQSIKRNNASIEQAAVSEKTEANNETTQAPSKSTSPASSNTKATGVNLNDPEVAKVIAQLESRDREVRMHEQAHAAVGGQYVTSGPSYTYQTGPDGKRYAVGGNVGIDVSPIPNDPQATLAKARQVIQAAMAPAEPSSQDYAVAQSAQAMMQQAQQELATQQQASMTGETDDESETSKSTQPSQNDNQRAASRFEQEASRFYEQTEIATNGLVGRVGGYQDSALRLGLRLQA
ncbi:MAG: hypothetical protein IE928_08030 [Gammaproteobacteria bacterium]|nr:hypothetical protein [Gammaproteobacteria bacterium]